MDNMLQTDDLDYLGAVAESSDMMAEYRARAEAGEAVPVDRANAALLATEQAVGILTGDRENVPASKRAVLLARFKLVREMAAKAGRCHDEDVASLWAARCEAVATEVRAFDSARFDGLTVPVPFADGRAGRIARQGGKDN